MCQAHSGENEPRTGFPVRLDKAQASRLIFCRGRRDYPASYTLQAQSQMMTWYDWYAIRNLRILNMLSRNLISPDQPLKDRDEGQTSKYSHINV